MDKFKFVLLGLIIINSLVVTQIVGSNVNLSFSDPFLYTVTLLIAWVAYDLGRGKNK